MHKSIDIKQYEEEVRNMSVNQFVDLVNQYDISTTYNYSKIQIHKTNANRLIKEWKSYLYKEFLRNSLRDSKLNDARLIYEINNKIDKSFDVMIRYEYIQYILTFSPINRSGYTCTVFAIKAQSTIYKTNYAYLYSIITENEGIPNIEHKYVCLGPNMISADGEYRNRMTNFSVINNIKSEYHDIWNDIDEYLTHKSSVTYSQNYYISHQTPNSCIKPLKDDIESNRFVIDLYILSWLSQGIERYHKFQNTGVDIEYNKNMFNTEDEKMLDHYVNKYSNDTLMMFMWKVSYIQDEIYSIITEKNKPDNLIRYNPKLGQKIILLEDEHILYAKNILYAPWRELYISELMNDLIINLICPGVPIFVDWIYINGVDHFIFNNPSIKGRVILSDDFKQKKNTTSKPISDRSLDGSIADTTNLIVSDVGILMITEHVGKTLSNVQQNIQSNTYNLHKHTAYSMFSNIEQMSRYLFDITYTLLCMNSKFNVIHGDLHLNNVTINIGIPYYKNDPIKDVAYIIDSKMYYFKENGIRGTIIDFSRSIIIPDDHNIYRQIKSQQCDLIYNYYSMILPKFTNKYGSKLKIHIIKNFRLVFKIVTAIDMFVHTDRLLKYINIYPHLNTTSDVISIITKINKIATYYLTVVMKESMKNKINIPYPNYDIISQCFNTYVSSADEYLEKKIDMCEIYFYNNKLKYSMLRLNKMPPRFKYPHLKKHNDDTILPLPKSLNNHKYSNLKKYYKSKQNDNKII